MSATTQDLDRLLAVTDELGSLFRTAEPGTDANRRYHADFLCRCLLGADRHVDALVDEIERLAPSFFSHCAQAGGSVDLETLRQVITDDLLYHVRVRLVLLHRWKCEEAGRFAW